MQLIKKEGLTNICKREDLIQSLTIVEARISIDLYNELIRDDLE